MECRAVTTFGIFLTATLLWSCTGSGRTSKVNYAELACAAEDFTGPMPFCHLTNSVKELKE